jgi:hypothetical protein|tara:strand:+ start:82 stop:255 length:174 start_codon:yes stop_codon:yes gene_type:complete
MKYIPPYVLDRLARREKHNREELRKQLPLPQPWPIPLQKNPETKEEKEKIIIIDMRG